MLFELLATAITRVYNRMIVSISREREARVKVFYDRDADLAVLKDKVIAMIGYGNQGRS